ncbi:fimbria/pilus outer membrane usher protein [Burkholderia territorii]|uniref:fimbria/pilus outer membrane usher protein n=1 Tax=Burkholderia territorii TaxID=1503055 RepID=UPI00075574F4|nr:fimbria/pilus outer membrane usher protein [Burkholderia territorii]KVK95379.1 fimbrial protein [Burkholderia territorii]
MSNHLTSEELRQTSDGQAFVARAAATPLYLALCLSLFNKAHAAEAGTSLPEVDAPLPVFNTNFLNMRGGAVDLAAVLSSGNSVPPGTYRVEVQVNGDLVGRRDIDFRQDSADGKVRPCITAKMLKDFGVDLNAVKLAPDIGGTACLELPQLIDHATVRFDAGRLRLDLGIPQAFLSRTARGYVDPALWDEGVTAGYVNYQFSGNYVRSKIGGDSRSYFLGLQNGVNIGVWRLRNESTLTDGVGGATRFRSNRTLVQRDITSLKGQLTLGEQYSDSTLFDSVRFRGVQLTSDDAMLPDSERGYAPVIRGQAISNAIVEVRQSGYVLYRANVPPGPFALTDVFPSGSNGDLEITVIEADGSKRVTYQAFSSLPLMVRKGGLKYNFFAGQYWGSQDATPNLLGGSIVYGLTDNTTIAGGFQASSDFQALNVGIGTNTPVGALSVDVTQSISRAQGRREAGQSVRVLYARTFSRTNTNFTLAAYRYSTAAYRTFNDHVDDAAGPTGLQRGRSRSRIELTTSQDLGAERRYGSVYMTLSQQTFWNAPGSSRSVALGYGSNLGLFSYNLSLSQTRDFRTGGGGRNTQAMLTMSLPLGSKVRSARMYTNVAHDGYSGTNIQSGLSGYLGEETTYALQAGRAGSGQGVTAGASVGRGFDIGQMSGSYNYAANYQSVNVSASGAVVMHGGGVNLSRTVGETFALMKVNATQETNERADFGSAFDRNGYTVVTYAQPYRRNALRPDTRNLGADVELDDGVKQVVPRRGAIVEAVFNANSGRRVQFTVQQADGRPVPFGASLEDAGTGKRLAIVDPGGKAFVLVEQNRGTLGVKWSDGQCQAPYQLSTVEAGRYYQRQILRCR